MKPRRNPCSTAGGSAFHSSALIGMQSGRVRRLVLKSEFTVRSPFDKRGSRQQSSGRFLPYPNEPENRVERAAAFWRRRPFGKRGVGSNRTWRRRRLHPRVCGRSLAPASKEQRSFEALSWSSACCPTHPTPAQTRPTKTTNRTKPDPIASDDLKIVSGWRN